MRQQSASVGIVIPTYNAESYWGQLQEGLDEQSVSPSRIVIVDSSSVDGTRRLAQRAGYQVVRIPKKEFNHGSTRSLACTYLADSEFLVFMTQDAILADPKSLEKLCAPLSDPQIGAAYGRQLPRATADPIERHGRLFNYPVTSQLRSLESRNELGFKTAFFSNSFAVYRRVALEEVGGFPGDAIVSEEVTAVAKMLIAGWKIAYQADAEVIHSHHLSPAREFSRYFDIGVHHGRNPWLRQTFGSTNDDGLRFIRSELNFLRANNPLWLPYAALRNISKYLAYQLGTHEERLPDLLCRCLSGHASYWMKPAAQDLQRKTIGPGQEPAVDDEPASGAGEFNTGKPRITVRPDFVK